MWRTHCSLINITHWNTALANEVLEIASESASCALPCLSPRRLPARHKHPLNEKGVQEAHRRDDFI